MQIQKGNGTNRKLMKQTMKSHSKFDASWSIKPLKKRMKGYSDSKMRSEELNKDRTIELLD
jgi:hypothetical protein